jgi:ligand-binding sensor domain-containing protein/signal transduction histidine kinase
MEFPSWAYSEGAPRALNAVSANRRKALGAVPVQRSNLLRNSSETTDDPFVCLRRQTRIVALLFLFTQSAWAASSPQDSLAASQYIRTEFTVDDQLPDNTVNTITETENGLLWVGTTSGLASFDGRTFTPIPLRVPGGLSASAVNTLIEGADGDLWVGTDAGVVRVPKKDLNDSYFTDSTAFRLGEQQSDNVEILFKARDGTIWAGTEHGLYRFDGTRFLCEVSNLYVGRINQALSGQLILNTGKGYAEFDGKHIIWRPSLSARFRVPDNQIFDSYQDSDGTIWYCTHAGLRATNGQTSVTISPYGLDRVPAYHIFMGPNGALWVNTKLGIYRISGDRMWAPAPDLHARSFYAGKEGDLWIGTNGNGLVHLLPRIVQMYNRADGLPNDIAMSVLAAHDGRLWVGLNCGLAVFDGNQFKTFNEKSGLGNACVWSLAEDRKQNIWIGTYGGGLFRYSNGNFRQYTLGQERADPIVLDIAVARDDSLWIATPDGVSHMQDGNVRNYTTKDGLSSARVLAIHQDRAGVIWVATQGGVDRYTSDRFVPLPAAKSINQVLARRIVENSRGDLYATDVPQGISQIKNGQLTQLDSALNVFDMIESPDHMLWFSSKNGVIRISERELSKAGTSDAPLDYEVFNRVDGLDTTQASVGAPNIAITPDGKLWVATVKGLAMIDTQHLSRPGRTPKVFISGVSSDGKSILVRDGLALGPGIHHVELHLAAINLANPQKIRLQYRMDGVDSDWLDATASRMAVYTNIPAGEHRLLVRATDSLGHWAEPQQVYTVTQKPHFYARPVFQIGAIAAVVLLLVSGSMVRVQYMVKQARVILEQRQVEREAVARDLHDTFVQGVQGLILRFHTGTQQLPPDSPVRESFEQALTQADSVMLEGRSVLSRLRSKETKPGNLAESYSAMGLELRSLNPVPLEIVVSGSGRNLDTVVQEELSRIGREALFNAYVHSNASRIEVEIHFGVFEFKVCFRDNGAGIDSMILTAGGVTGHYGLQGMRERVSKIGGHMELWSRPGAGTEIDIRVPGAIAYRQAESTTRWRWIHRLLRSRAL